MCGITGAVWTNPAKEISPDLLAKMTAALQHRGPDDEQFHFAEQTVATQQQLGVALGFRRLSIIDVAGGQQPISNEDKTIQLVFNGEIYNYLELRERLEGNGHQFKTSGDAETIVHLYEELGTDCFAELNGMFALAIWDSRKSRLVIARDRIGQKPLVYRQESDRFLFASELKSLLQIPGLPREVDPQAIDEFLVYQYIPHPKSILRGFNKLPPGHFGVLQFDSQSKNPAFKTERYWNPDLTEDSTLSEEDACERLRELFLSSVKLRMQSEVPFGAFLSGGVDSSVVVAAMVRQLDQPVKTFSIGFPVKAFDESEYAKLVADHLKTEHHSFTVTPDAQSILDELVYLYDEPFGDSSAIPTWYVSKLTRDHVTVALSGDGGDELFAGYDRYKAVRLASRFDKLGPLKKIFSSKIWQLIPSSSSQRSRVRQLKRFLQALGLPGLQRYLDWISIFNKEGRRDLFNTDLNDQLKEFDAIHFLKGYHDQLDHRDAVSAISLSDLQTYLPGDLNTKVDIASMGNSLECRQPFLDHRLVEFAISLPVRFKQRGNQGKWILKKAFGDWIPESIFTRRKMGFGVPIGEWFRGELKELLHETVLSKDAACLQYFAHESIQRLFDEHQQKRFDHSYRLWSILMFELWMQKWL